MKTSIDNRIQKALKFKYIEMSSSIIEETQVRQYFKNKRESFHIPLQPAGTEFQKSVWNALIQIAFGKYRIIPIMFQND